MIDQVTPALARALPPLPKPFFNILFEHVVMGATHASTISPIKKS
jgi:hypothetical protein